MLYNFSEFQKINEDAKDDMRINDIISKSNGDLNKQISLAKNMADKITGKEKAMNRYLAASKILGDDNTITQIFAAKAKELGNNVTIRTSKIEEPKELQVKPLFVYDAQKGSELFKIFTEMVTKLRGHNWGQDFTAKINKTFTDEELLNLVITCYDYPGNGVRKYIPGFHTEGDYQKYFYAWEYPLKIAKAKNLFNLFDLGDAKTNPSNPMHILFFDENKKEKEAADLEELRLACQSAYSEYKPNSYLFDEGESYISYYNQGKTNQSIKFNNPWSMYFWNNNMIGQMSDGYWENSRKYDGEWQYWVKLKPIFDPNVNYRNKDTKNIRDIMNPKLVQQYAIQSEGEWLALRKIARMNNSDLLPLLRRSYGRSTEKFEINGVKNLKNAEKIAKDLGIELNLYLAFLYEPGISLSEAKKIVSQAHSDILLAMINTSGI